MAFSQLTNILLILALLWRYTQNVSFPSRIKKYSCTSSHNYCN